MSNTPRRNWLLAGSYVLIAGMILGAALIWPGVRTVAYAPLRDWLLPNFFLPAGQAATLTVAAPPALEGWLRAAAADFMQQNALLDIQVTVLRGVEAGQKLNAVGAGQPDVWIAEADFVRTSLGSVAYEATGPAVAHDSLIWVAGQTSAVAAAPGWQTVYSAVRAQPQFMVGLPPAGSVEGWAACLSAAADYHQATDISAAQVNDAAFQQWLGAILAAAPSRQRNPRDQLASRPPEVQAGLVWQTDWHLLAQQSLNRQPPAHTAVFNYPYLVRSNWYDVSGADVEARKAVAKQFREFLLSNGVQSQLAAYGLERASAQYTGQAQPLDAAAIRALQICWQ